MNDIQNRKDIELLVDTFYQSATVDPLIGHYFTEVVSLNMEKHAVIICDFWESVLFSTTDYRGNVMLPHLKMDKLSPFEEAHFEKWMDLWQTTIEKLFYGEKADLAIERAQMIRKLMWHKIQNLRSSDHGNLLG